MCITTQTPLIVNSYRLLESFFVFFGYHIWQQSSGDVSISVWDSPETTASSYIQSDGSAPPYKPWESVVCYHARHINHYAYHPPLQRNCPSTVPAEEISTSFCYCREGHIINHKTHLLYLPRATTDWKMRVSQSRWGCLSAVWGPVSWLTVKSLTEFIKISLWELGNAVGIGASIWKLK